MNDSSLQEKKLIEKFKSLVAPVYGLQAAEKTIMSCIKLDEVDDASCIFDSVVGQAMAH